VRAAKPRPSKDERHTFKSQALSAGIAEWPTGKRGAEINIQRDQDDDDYQHGQYDLAFCRHLSSQALRGGAAGEGAKIPPFAALQILPAQRAILAGRELES
jgi:hypothetical protein